MRSDDLKPLVELLYEVYKVISIRGFLLVAHTGWPMFSRVKPAISWAQMASMKLGCLSAHFLYVWSKRGK